MSPRIDLPTDDDQPMEPSFAEWLAGELVALVSDARPGRRSIITVAGVAIEISWEPSEALLALATDPDPADWAVQGLPHPVLGTPRWGGPLIDWKYLARPVRAEVVREMYVGQLREAGWIDGDGSPSAAWQVTERNASPDAREAAVLVLGALEDIYHCPISPLTMVVFDSTPPSPT